MWLLQRKGDEGTQLKVHFLNFMCCNNRTKQIPPFHCVSEILWSVLVHPSVLAGIQFELWLTASVTDRGPWQSPWRFRSPLAMLQMTPWHQGWGQHTVEPYPQTLERGGCQELRAGSKIDGREDKQWIWNVKRDTWRQRGSGRESEGRIETDKGSRARDREQQI